MPRQKKKDIEEIVLVAKLKPKDAALIRRGGKSTI